MAVVHAKSGKLPAGIHEVTWDWLVATLAGSPHRLRLLSGLRRAALNLKAAGCTTLYVDGSFVTDESYPNDFDGCWEPAGVDPKLLDPVLLEFSNGRLAQKLKYHGELFPSSASAETNAPWRTFLEFFQVDKVTGNAKGIVKLDLRSLK